VALDELTISIGLRMLICVNVAEKQIQFDGKLSDLTYRVNEMVADSTVPLVLRFSSS